MKKQYRILIADGGDTFAPIFANDLHKAGCWTMIRRQNRDSIINAVRRDHPDLTVLNLTQPTLDFCRLSQDLLSISELQILALYRSETLFLEALLRQYGVSCWRMPDQISDLTRAVLRHFCPEQPLTETPPDEHDIELDVTGLLHAAGIPQKLQGFQFLRSAILKLYRAPKSARLTMRDLYPVIAREFRSTAASVERSIRLAITQAWDQRGAGSFAAFQFPAGQTRRMTNSEFVSFAADWLRLSEKNKS